MKTLVWLDKEQVTISGVGLVSKGSIFDIDDKRAASFIKQKKAKAQGDTVKDSVKETETVKKGK